MRHVFLYNRCRYSQEKLLFALLVYSKKTSRVFDTNQKKKKHTHIKTNYSKTKEYPAEIRRPNCKHRTISSN